MGLCYCRTVAIGIYHEKNQFITLKELRLLFPRVPEKRAKEALKEARKNRAKAIHILKHEKPPEAVRRPSVKRKQREQEMIDRPSSALVI